MIGLDISSGLVKLLELSQDAQGYRVESYAVEFLPPDVVQDREIKNPGALGSAIEEVVRRSRTGLKQAAVAVSGSAVITKVIQITTGLKGKDLLLQVQLEAERHIPFPLQEVNLDFQVLGPSAKNPEMSDVLLAASRTEIVDMLVHVLHLGGMKAAVVDIETYAMQRAFSLIADQLPDKGAKKTVAVVDIGSSSTTFSVLHDCATVYTRDQAFGGKQLTEEIQRRYGLTTEEANLAKRQGGLPDDYVPEVLEPFKEAIVQQISRATQLFFSSSHFSDIDHIVLAGGCASIQGVLEKVQEKGGVPTTIANPLVNMSVSSKVSMPAIQADAPSLMICCGLAMRSFADAEH